MCVLWPNIHCQFSMKSHFCQHIRKEVLKIGLIKYFPLMQHLRKRHQFKMVDIFRISKIALNIYYDQVFFNWQFDLFKMSGFEKNLHPFSVQSPTIAFCLDSYNNNNSLYLLLLILLDICPICGHFGRPLQLRSILSEIIYGPHPSSAPWVGPQILNGDAPRGTATALVRGSSQGLYPLPYQFLQPLKKINLQTFKFVAHA